MTTITIQEAQANLPDLIHSLKPGEELVIVENNHPLAVLVALPRAQLRPMPGSARGMLTIVADDDEHLEDFKEYMPTSDGPGIN